MSLNYPIALTTNDHAINRAFRIACGDLIGNIVPFSDGLLTTARPAIVAGMDYDTPWTRDAAINVMNAAGLLFPDEAKNTLLSVLDYVDGQVRIIGQYWDAIIWVEGAWAYYRYTGDRAFLALALAATCNSLDYFEASEFDAADNLFRGAACYGDGISAYPDVYVVPGLPDDCIQDWPAHNRERTASPGFGLPEHDPERPLRHTFFPGRHRLPPPAAGRPAASRTHRPPLSQHAPGHYRRGQRRYGERVHGEWRDDASIPAGDTGGRAAGEGDSEQ